MCARVVLPCLWPPRPAPQEQIQAVIDAALIPPLITLLSTAEFDIKKEAAWAISNATSGGSADQIRVLVQYGAIKPLCDLVTVNDARIVTVALEGLENILKVGVCWRMMWLGVDIFTGGCVCV